MFEILCNFSCFQLLLKPLQICNALSTTTQLLSMGEFHAHFKTFVVDWLFVTANFLMNVRTCFY